MGLIFLKCNCNGATVQHLFCRLKKNVYLCSCKRIYMHMQNEAYNALILREKYPPPISL